MNWNTLYFVGEYSGVGDCVFDCFGYLATYPPRENRRFELFEYCLLT